MIKNFDEFIKELNHSTNGEYINVNLPTYGQGAHHGDWGVNYGSQGDGNTFGDKGDGDPNIPTLKKKYPSFPKALLNPVTNKYMAEDEIEDLLNDYYIWCRQNNETPDEFEGLDSNIIGYIYNKINK